MMQPPLRTPSPPAASKPPSPPPGPGRPPQAPPPPRRTRYRLYIDESGDHTYKLLDDLSHRYLSLLGVWFRQVDHYTTFAEDLDRFKREVFGPRPDAPVVLHRSDIINRKGLRKGVPVIEWQSTNEKAPFGACFAPALTGCPPAESRITKHYRLEYGAVSTNNPPFFSGRPGVPPDDQEPAAPPGAAEPQGPRLFCNMFP